VCRVRALQPGIDGYVDAVEIGRGGFVVVHRARRTALYRDARGALDAAPTVECLPDHPSPRR
jgi:hypothetical protein